MDIESPKSQDEKALDRQIAELYSRQNANILEINKLKKLIEDYNETSK